MDAVYIIDTSELINLDKQYPGHVFPKLWRNVEKLISEERILAPEEVLDEIKLGHGGLSEWCRKHRRMFRKTDALLDQVREIVGKHPKLVKHNLTRDTADPYIIALAVSHKNDISGLVPILVTAENVKREPGIPYAARECGIETCKLVGMFQREGWTF